MIRLLAVSTVGLLLLCVPGVATATPRWAPAAAATIRPGVALLTPLDARSGTACTANYVFSASGGTYLGMAAHCAGTGSSEAGSGCTEPTLPLGTTVLVRRSDGDTSTATLAYSSWITMRERGERDSRRCSCNEFAHVALAAADVARPSRCWAARTPSTPTACARTACARASRWRATHPTTARPPSTAAPASATTTAACCATPAAASSTATAPRSGCSPRSSTMPGTATA